MQPQSTKNGRSTAARHTAPPATSPHRPRLAVVGRVSTREQEQYGTSIEDQAEKGALLAQLHDMEVVDSSAYQGDESGALPLAARPIMGRLIADARARRFDAVCFHKIDRIARRLSYILEVWDELTAAGVSVYIIEPAIDTSTIMGRLLRNVLGTIAEFERDLLLERTGGGRAREMAGGAVYAPRGKYGYQYHRRDRAGGVVPHVTLHPEHAEVVRRIYRLRMRRWSHERIATLLTAEGLPTPAQAAGHKRRGDRWYDSAVAAILRDPTYMGQGLWGATTYVRDGRGRRRRVCLPEGQAPTQIAYPGVVTPEEWHAAQAVSEPHGGHAVKTSAQEYLLFGGMARCTEHDRALCCSRDFGTRRRYRCVRALPAGGRTTHGVNAADLDAAVWGLICSAMLDSDLMVEAARALAQEAEEGLEEVARRRAEIGARLAALDDQLRWVYRDLREAGATPAEIAEQARLVREEQARLHAEGEPLAARLALAQENLPRAEAVRLLCERFTQRARTATPEVKRELLEELEVAVLVEGDAFRIDGVLAPLELGGTLTVQESVSAGRFACVHGVPFVLEGCLGRGAEQAAVGGQHAGHERGAVVGGGQGTEVA